MWIKLQGFAKKLQNPTYELAGGLLIVDNLVQGYVKRLQMCCLLSQDQ